MCRAGHLRGAAADGQRARRRPAPMPPGISACQPPFSVRTILEKRTVEQPFIGTSYLRDISLNATLSDSRRWDSRGVRVAIVAESFLPNVNGVTNSVLRVIEHLRRTGHEALVIAPDTPRGEPPADKVHEGVRVHRVPSRMFPKINSLPLGVPRPRMVGVLRGFDPDVVHLASPALLGYGGLHAARYLDVPTVAVFQTDVAGFAESYGIGICRKGRVGMDTAPAQRADRTLAPSTAAMENLDRPPHPAGAQVGAWCRHHRLRAVGARRRTAPQVVAGRQADHRVRRAGSRRRSTSSGWRCWRRATTCRW